MIVAATFLGVTMISLIFRFRVMAIKTGLSVDNWYWLLCAEDVRRRKRLPARLPYFLLEEAEQWYPPLYSVFLALFPGKFLERWGAYLSQTIDLLYGPAIFWGVYLTSGSLFIAGLSAFSLGIAYLPLYYNLQLQPRSPANLVLAGVMLSVWLHLSSGSLLGWSAALIGTTLLLLLHKMTTQMLVVYLIATSLWFGSASVALLPAAAILLALLVSGGFYLKTLRAHWDIVTFWHENIRRLGSHQYYESLRYRKTGHRSTAIHRPGLRCAARKALNIFYANPFILLLPALLPVLWNLDASPFQRFLWLWLLTTYGWVLTTTYVPFATALGAGVYYAYHAFFPLFVLVAGYWEHFGIPERLIILGLWGAGAFLSIWLIARFCLADSVNPLERGLRSVLEDLSRLPGRRVFCIPFTLPDITAYATRKEVFWGGHSYGFHKRLKPYFPVMQADVKETLSAWKLDYVLFWRPYLNRLEDIGLAEGRDLRRICEHGDYALYEVIR